MAEFYVYENWTHDRARVHRGECSHCNFGAGIHPETGARNGRWHECRSYTEAAGLVRTLARADTADCSTCHPSGPG